jgi:CheY-like chemotaxis protein
MRSLATARKIQLAFEVHPSTENIRIATDRTKVIQIVNNIVNNAIKFTGKGVINVKFLLIDSLQEGIAGWHKSATTYQGVAFTMKEGEMLTSLEDVKFRVAPHVTPPGHQWMCVSVTDNGCGMNPSELVEMFEPYTQASTSSGNRMKVGTGLGLFICVSLCLQMQGFIGCASSPDVGTAFEFGIPVHLESLDGEEDESMLLSEPSEPLSDLVIPMTGPIMVVDDNVVNVKILKRTLERQLKVAELEIEVIIANGGDAAVELYKERRPSLCIVDYHMPGKDGDEVAREIRAWEAENLQPASYILSYTADATDLSKEIIMQYANDIMTKPPPKGYLQGLVSRLRVDV